MTHETPENGMAARINALEAALVELCEANQPTSRRRLGPAMGARQIRKAASWEAAHDLIDEKKVTS